MNALLKFSSLIDQLTEKIGLIANRIVLAACVISAGNAVMRYGFSLSSNAWLEIQWYLVAVIIFWPGLVTSRLDRLVADAPAVIEAPAPDRGEQQEDQSADIERQLQQSR